MQISSRFTIAIHMLACMAVFKDGYKITSDFLASSIHVNPVIIGKILLQLKDAGLIEVLVTLPQRKKSAWKTSFENTCDCGKQDSPKGRYGGAVRAGSGDPRKTK